MADTQIKAQRTTLHDIAELAGVTRMIVSRYSHTPEKVKPETTEHIASVIVKIGYQPNPDNPAMTSVAASWIGVFIPSFYSQILADLLANIESVAAGYGCQTLVVNYGYNCQREGEQTAAVLAFNVKGLLLIGSVHSLWADKHLNTTKTPIAGVMGLAENPGCISVGFDNFRVGFDMTTVLLASGKRRIICFGSMSGARDEQYYLGYCRAMENAGLAVGRIAPNKVSSVPIGTDMMILTRQMYADMGGILCTNDDLTVGVLQECLASGINMPQELAIAGFHGLEIGQTVFPWLASVLTPRFEMGKAATEISIKKIKGLPTIEEVDLHYRLSMGEAIQRPSTNARRVLAKG